MQHFYSFKKKREKSTPYFTLHPVNKNENPRLGSNGINDVSEKCIDMILSFSKNLETHQSALLNKNIEFIKS